MPTREQDQQLVERVQRGDKRAFDLLVLEIPAQDTGIDRAVRARRPEAQDVAQEAFIKAYRALGNFRGDSAFIPGCIGSPSTPRRTTWSLAGVGHRTAM
ncbi:sigma factor [Pseudomonas aeruginosa]|nr:sigma factor [Pseudomonas aeruginosa]